MDVDQLSMTLLSSILFFLIGMAAFFSASETGMMSLNRYRLKHLAKTDPRAKRISQLLARPDRLLGVILIGSTFVTTAASALTTIIAKKFFDTSDVEVLAILGASVVLTLILLIFAEIMPKVLAAHKPEATSYITVLPLQFLLWILYPLVSMANMASNGILKLFGVGLTHRKVESLNTEELRTIVLEASGFIPSHHQAMLLSILDLEKVRVDHIMIPRNEVYGIDLDDPEAPILTQLLQTEHTLLPVYRHDLDNVVGILHTRDVVDLLAHNKFTEQELLVLVDEPYFVPEGTSLHTQLLNFQRNKRRMGLVVDEYGDVLGLVTLEDILEEIVGEFTTDVMSPEREVRAEEDGGYLVDGSLSIRELNRNLQWELPVDGPKTLSGLIIEYLEAIPYPGTCVLIAGYPVEVLELKDNKVKTARISPRLSRYIRHQDH